MPIRIRRASPADEAAIDQWQRSLENLDEYLHLGNGTVRDPSVVRQRFVEWLRQPREKKIPHGWERIDLVAVEDSGAICGYSVLNLGVQDPLTGQPEAFITELHVWPDYRRRGVAKGLLEMAEAYAAQRGVEYLSLHVSARNLGAIRLLEGTGYRIETTKLTKRVQRNNAT